MTKYLTIVFISLGMAFAGMNAEAKGKGSKKAPHSHPAKAPKKAK